MGQCPQLIQWFNRNLLGLILRPNLLTVPIFNLEMRNVTILAIVLIGVGSTHFSPGIDATDLEYSVRV